MSSAKDLIVKVIAAKDAIPFVRKHHYSGKVVNNSKLHFGVFLNNQLHGVMSFGSPLDKRKVLPLVKGTLWNEMLELNRMAFDDILPKNSESRAISIAMKLIRKNAPHIKWVLSFADGTQCGDGTIYRASGFVLTSIKVNNQIWEAPTGEVFNDTSIRPGIGSVQTRNKAYSVFARTSLTDGRSKQQQRAAVAVVSRTTATKGSNILETGASSMKFFKDAGWKPKEGYQLRYIYLIDKTAQLTVPIIPFSEIERCGAGMYKGQKRAASIDSDASTFQVEKGGAIPTAALQHIDG